MNKRNLHKILSDRFEREAATGFNSTPGAEAYFNNLGNPFTQKKYTSGTKGNLRILLLEIGLMSGLLLFLKFGWTTVETPASFPLKKELTVLEKPDALPEAIPVKTTTSPVVPATVHQYLPQHLQQKSFVRPAGNDTAQTALVPVLINHPHEAITDSVAPEVQPKNFHYSDYRSLYKLRYLSDILVIDYGDSISRLKLEPILTGSPANVEGNVTSAIHQEPPVFHTVKQNLYLEELEKGMKSFRAGEWKKAMEVFNGLFAKNSLDQNAIFYGALCLYEKGKYQECIDRLGELLEIPQPVFEQDADYYLALGLMKNGDTSRALGQLKKIAASDSFYRDKATVLLRELR